MYIYTRDLASPIVIRHLGSLGRGGGIEGRLQQSTPQDFELSNGSLDSSFFSYINWRDNNCHGELWRLKTVMSVKVWPMLVLQTVILHKLPNFQEAQFPVCTMEVTTVPFSSAFPSVTFGSWAMEHLAKLEELCSWSSTWRGKVPSLWVGSRVPSHWETKSLALTHGSLRSLVNPLHILFLVKPNKQTPSFPSLPCYSVWM